MLKAAKQTYDKKANDIGDLEVRVDTLTVDAYIDFDDKIVLVAVRGTKPTEMHDLLADIIMDLKNLPVFREIQKCLVVFYNVILLQKALGIFDRTVSLTWWCNR